MDAAEPIDVAFDDNKDANGVPALIVVFPYVIFSSAINDSPFSNGLNSKLLSESIYLTYIVKSSTLISSGKAINWIVAVVPDIWPVTFLPINFSI